MDHFHAPTPQSATSIQPGLTPYCRQSAPVVYDVLMTPPVSPSHSEDGTDTNAVVVRQDQGLYTEKPSNRELQLPRHQGPVAQATYPQRLRTPSPQPVRSLENEQVHVEKPGVLKLTDFEVRGTLGTVPLLPLGSRITYYFLQVPEHLVAFSWFVSSQQLPGLRTFSP